MRTLYRHSPLLTSIVLSMIFSSCVTQKAVIKSQEKLHTGAEIVKPAWSYKESGAAKLSPFIGAGIGAGVGYNNKISYDGKEYKGFQSALIFGLAGYVATTLIKSWIVGPKKKEYDNEDRNWWLKTYNEQHNYDFVILREYINRDLLLVPGNNIAAYKKKAAELAREKAIRQERNAALFLAIIAKISQATAPSKEGLDSRLSSFIPNNNANTNEATLRIYCNGKMIKTYTIVSEKGRYTCSGCWGSSFSRLDDLIEELLSRESC